jgi:hypothetical protein
MQALIHKLSAATYLRLSPPFVLVAGPAAYPVSAPNEHQLTNQPFFYPPMRPTDAGVMAVVEAALHRHSTLARRCHQTPPSLQVVSQGLLAQDVPPTLNSGAGYFGVDVRRCANHHCLDIRVVDGFLPPLKGCTTELRRNLLCRSKVDISDRHQPVVSEVAQRGGATAPLKPRPYQTDVHQAAPSLFTVWNAPAAASRTAL